MAKNQLSSIQRYELQNWLHRQAKLTPAFAGCSDPVDIARNAIADLKFNVVPSHIKKNMKILGLWRSGRRCSISPINSKYAIRKSFTCECDRSYSMGVYKLK